VLGKDVVAVSKDGQRDIYGGALMAVVDELSASSIGVVEFRLRSRSFAAQTCSASHFVSSSHHA